MAQSQLTFEEAVALAARALAGTGIDPRAWLRAQSGLRPPYDADQVIKRARRRAAIIKIRIGVPTYAATFEAEPDTEPGLEF